MSLRVVCVGGHQLGVVYINNPAWRVQGTQTLESCGPSTMWAKAEAGMWVVYGLLLGQEVREQEIRWRSGWG